MSKFYGEIRGSRGSATRCGSKKSGLTTVAASWAGAIEVHVFELDEVECFVVTMIPWHGNGPFKILCTGKIGKAPIEIG